MAFLFLRGFQSRLELLTTIVLTKKETRKANFIVLWNRVASQRMKNFRYRTASFKKSCKEIWGIIRLQLYVNVHK